MLVLYYLYIKISYFKLYNQINNIYIQENKILIKVVKLNKMTFNLFALIIFDIAKK